MRGCDPPKAPTSHLNPLGAVPRGLSPALREVVWGVGDMAGVCAMGPGRAAWDWADPAGNVQCLPMFDLALHRADISSLVRHYALCDNYKNMKIGLEVPSRQHEASSNPMCVFLLPLRG